MSDSPHPISRVLQQLEAAKIHYRISQLRGKTVMVEAHVPGRHYEIEVFEDGAVKVEVYKSDGQIGGKEALDDLVQEFSDSHDNAA
jgi:hypothetical protein